jgi:hypothetical protein
VERRANHKLAFKYFGPFPVLARVAAVAYKLDLPATSRIHPAFHVSQLKPCVSAGHQVLPHLPSPDALLQVPVHVLQCRVREQGHRTVVRVLVQWSGFSEEMATWEDLVSLRQRFPRASAWGQAEFQGEGNVSVPAPPADNWDDQDASGERRTPTPRPRRATRLPAWLACHDLGPRQPI